MGKENLTPFKPGDSAPVEAQKKSVKKRKENRTMREIALEILKQKGRKEKGIEALIVKYENGDLAAFDRLRDLIREKDDDGRETAPSFNLVVNGETADILKKIIGK